MPLIQGVIFFFRTLTQEQCPNDDPKQCTTLHIVAGGSSAQCAHTARTIAGIASTVASAGMRCCKGLAPCRSAQHRAAKPGRPRHQGLCCNAQKADLVVTPIPCSDTKNCVATPNGRSLSRHQKTMPRHQTAKLCRDTKSCVATPKCQAHVATPKTVSQ